jgi:hypothetical protein
LHQGFLALHISWNIGLNASKEQGTKQPSENASWLRRRQVDNFSGAYGQLEKLIPEHLQTK